MAFRRYSPPNLPSLSQQDRVAWNGLTEYLPQFEAQVRSKYLKFDHKQDGLDYYTALGGPEGGDTFYSTGRDGPGNGDLGVASLWLYVEPIPSHAGKWLVWDLETVTNYQPALSGYTLGDGTQFGKFMREGPFVWVNWFSLFGTTSSITNFNGIDFPNASNSDLDYDLNAATGGAVDRDDTGVAQFTDAAVQGYVGFSRVESTTRWRLLGGTVAALGGGLRGNAVSAGFPLAFGAGDTLSGTLRYRIDVDVDAGA